MIHTLMRYHLKEGSKQVITKIMPVTKANILPAMIMK
jgi:hypothetical protein